MSELSEHVTDQPKNEPCGTDITKEPRHTDEDYDPARFLLPLPKTNTLWPKVVVSGVLLCIVVVGVGLLFPAVSKVRPAAAGSQSMNNVKQIVLAMNNIAGNTTTGDLPPANGPFPANGGRNASFFEHLLPYIEQGPLYDAASRNVPVMTYIAPADSRNPGIDATISYCTNGTVLSGTPRLPKSFGGRTSAVICIMERSGMDGAHKWTNGNNVLGSPGNPPPFPQINAQPGAYWEGAPQGFTSAGCSVAMADGSARTITSKQVSAWNWACDPTDRSPQPPGW